MASRGRQDVLGNKQIPAHGSRIRKTTRRLSSNALPSYLQPSHLQSIAQVARLQSTTQEASSSSTQEPSIPPHTSLHRPATLPSAPSQSQPLDLPTYTSGSSEVPGCSAAEGSPPRGGFTAAGGSTSSPRSKRPRRNGTSEAPRVPSEKFVVVLSSDYKIIDHHLAKLVSTIFEEYPHDAAYTYKKIPDSVLQKYWEEFQKRCVWDGSAYSDDIMKRAFLGKLKDRYKGILNRIRQLGKRPLWCPNDVWVAWQGKWNSPEFKRKSAHAKKARVGKDGKAKGTHTGGSRAHAKTAKKLEKQMGKTITPDHLFVWTHTRKHDGITFINDRSKQIHARYENLTQGGGDQTTEVDGEAIDVREAFYKASGGRTKAGTIFGLGSAANQYYRDPRPRYIRAGSASSSGGASTPASDVEIQGIKATLQTIMDRLDGFSEDKAIFTEQLNRLEERQIRVERLLSGGAPLGSDANEVRELRERLISLETKIGSSLTQFQTSMSQLQGNVERFDSDSNSDSSNSDSDSDFMA